MFIVYAYTPISVLCILLLLLTYGNDGRRASSSSNVHTPFKEKHHVVVEREREWANKKLTSLLLPCTFFHHLMGSGSVGICRFNEPKRDIPRTHSLEIVNRKMPLINGRHIVQFFSILLSTMMLTVSPPFTAQCACIASIGFVRVYPWILPSLIFSSVFHTEQWYTRLFQGLKSHLYLYKVNGTIPTLSTCLRHSYCTFHTSIPYTLAE